MPTKFYKGKNCQKKNLKKSNSDPINITLYGLAVQGIMEMSQSNIFKKKTVRFPVLFSIELLLLFNLVKLIRYVIPFFNNSFFTASDPVEIRCERCVVMSRLGFVEFINTYSSETS